jgi:hypothetical protein
MKGKAKGKSKGKRQMANGKSVSAHELCSRRIFAICLLPFAF